MQVRRQQFWCEFFGILNKKNHYVFPGEKKLLFQSELLSIWKNILHNCSYYSCKTMRMLFYLNNNPMFLIHVNFHSIWFTLYYFLTHSPNVYTSYPRTVINRNYHSKENIIFWTCRNFQLRWMHQRPGPIIYQWDKIWRK